MCVKTAREVANSVAPNRCRRMQHLIGVYTVCSGLHVPILRVNTIPTRMASASQFECLSTRCNNLVFNIFSKFSFFYVVSRQLQGDNERLFAMKHCYNYRNELNCTSCWIQTRDLVIRSGALATQPRGHFPTRYILLQKKKKKKREKQNLVLGYSYLDLQ